MVGITAGLCCCTTDDEAGNVNAHDVEMIGASTKKKRRGAAMRSEQLFVIIMVAMRSRESNDAW